MSWYKIEIARLRENPEVVAEFAGDSYEAVKWLREQIKWLHKEPYMVPRFDGEEPLEGLDLRSADLNKGGKQ